MGIWGWGGGEEARIALSRIDPGSIAIRLSGGGRSGGKLSRNLPQSLTRERRKLASQWTTAAANASAISNLFSLLLLLFFNPPPPPHLPPPPAPFYFYSHRKKKFFREDLDSSCSLSPACEHVVAFPFTAPLRRILLC